jgi:pimeloyl-ACP methyl ester carboxylesterase
VFAASDLMRAATSGEVAAKVRNAYDEIAIVDLLPKVKTPTIVFHCRHDSFVPFEQGRLIATSIPNATFVTLESENHALLPDEPAWAKFVGDMENFLASGWGLNFDSYHEPQGSRVCFWPKADIPNCTAYVRFRE